MQQNQTKMINEEWKKTQNDAPFVLQDEMADLSILGLQWFILIPGLNHTGPHRPSDSRSKPYLYQGKKKKKK